MSCLAEGQFTLTVVVVVVIIIIIITWGSSVSIVSDCRLDDRGSIPVEAKDFSLTPVSRPALRPAQSPIQWVTGVLSQR
jgi:hypothetical protein